MKTAIVTDSIACPTQEQLEKYQWEIVPINVRFEGKVYRDWIDFTPQEGYQFLDKNPEDWATSAPSPGDFLSVYKKVVEEGAKEILCITLSQKISATWNSARLAADLAKIQLPQVKVEVIDSETVGAGETLLCLAAAKAAEAGKSFDEIVQLVKNLKKRVKVFILLETIRYIYRSGRVPEIASKVGVHLPLKPLLKISDGAIHFFGLATSKEKGVEKLLKNLKDYYPPTTRPAEGGAPNWDENLSEIGIMHADCLPEAVDLKEKVKNLFPAAQTFISEFSPVMGYATGRGTLVMGYFASE